MRLLTVFLLVCAAAVAGCADKSDGDTAWETKRAAAVNRFRPLVYNTDGCDILYWPDGLPVTRENFAARRLEYATNTHVTTVSYCPISSGFGHFTCRKAGEPVLGSVPRNGFRNSAAEFFALGTDALEMASDFCRTNGLELFVSVRVNDQHDTSSKPDALSALYPKFKIDHPEWIMGAIDPQDSRRRELYSGYSGWSCVNFAEKGVRDYMLSFVRDLVSNYDVDGIEYDFNRHFMLFRSVALGGVATEEEIGLMTQLMRDLRAVTEAAGRRKGRPIVVAMRIPDSREYDLAAGADIETWFRERLVDVWIGGGYFLLNRLRDSVEFAHRHGVKFYWSLDESRIPRHARFLKLPMLPGRNKVPFYAGRFSAAMEAGCDGVYVFNIENDFLREVASMNPRDTAGVAKTYFVTERGSGGYRPWNWLKDGGRFNRRPTVDPGEPRTIKDGETYAFEMFFGDDFGGANPPRVTAKALTNIKGSESISLCVNGKAVKAFLAEDGVFECNLPSGTLRKGNNRFSVTFPSPVPEGSTFNNFAIYIQP